MAARHADGRKRSGFSDERFVDFPELSRWLAENRREADAIRLISEHATRENEKGASLKPESLKKIFKGWASTYHEKPAKVTSIRHIALALGYPEPENLMREEPLPPADPESAGASPSSPPWPHHELPLALAKALRESTQQTEFLCPPGFLAEQLLEAVVQGLGPGFRLIQFDAHTVTNFRDLWHRLFRRIASLDGEADPKPVPDVLLSEEVAVRFKRLAVRGGIALVLQNLDHLLRVVLGTDGGGPAEEALAFVGEVRDLGPKAVILGTFGLNHLCDRVYNLPSPHNYTVQPFELCELWREWAAARTVAAGLDPDDPDLRRLVDASAEHPQALLYGLDRYKLLKYGAEPDKALARALGRISEVHSEVADRILDRAPRRLGECLTGRRWCEATGESVRLVEMLVAARVLRHDPDAPGMIVPQVKSWEMAWERRQPRDGGA